MALVYTGLMWSVIILAPEYLISVFSSDTALSADAVPALKLYFAAFIFMDLQYIGQTVFKSLNKRKQDVYKRQELTDRINALCEEKDRKKLTAAFVNDLLVQKGYLKEEEQDETRIRRVTEKGIAAGICEEERRSKFGGGHYYALIHTRESQEMIVAELKAYFTDFPSGSAPAEP